MPWDVLVNRLDRYLRIAYVSAVLAGLALAAEVTVLALSGSPEERRRQLAAAATSVAHWKPSVVLIVLSTIGALIAAYLVGVAARSVTFAVIVALINAVNLTAKPIARWWRGHPDLAASHARPDLPEQWKIPGLHRALNDARSSWRRARRSRGSRGTRGTRSRPLPAPRRHRHWAFAVKAIAWSLVHPFLPRITRTADVWPTLDRTYGAETINRVLERHPIKVRVTDLWRTKRSERERAIQEAETEVSLATEYCQLWLQRYAPEVAVPFRASRFAILGSAVLPAILLSRTLREIGGDLDVIQSLLGWLQWALWAGALVLFVGVLREGPGFSATVFQRFVLVELAETAHRETGATRSHVPRSDLPDD